MIELFTSYSLSEIIIFLIIFCIAVKELITFYDWIKTRIHQGYSKNYKDKEDKNKVQYKIEKMNKLFEEKEKKFDEKKEEISNNFQNINKKIQNLSEQINLLICSDRDDIKSYIVEKHHFFCYEQEWIDDYSLDCLERRFKHYTNEGGNSFIEELMTELRALPKQPPQ